MVPLLCMRSVFCSESERAKVCDFNLRHGNIAPLLLLKENRERGGAQLALQSMYRGYLLKVGLT
jgi:hypothetical protein